MLAQGTHSELEVVSARGAGVITEMTVKVGDLVKKDQLLGSLECDRELYAYKVAKIKADDKSMLDLAKAEVRMKGADLENRKEALKRRRAEKPDVDKAEAELDAAKAREGIVETNRKLTELELEKAEAELEKRRFRSPIDGKVIAVFHYKGEKVAEGEKMFTIVDPSMVGLEMKMPLAAAQTIPENGVMLVRAMGTEISQIARVVGIGDKPDKDGNVLVKLSTQVPVGVADPFAHSYEILSSPSAPPPEQQLPDTPALPEATPKAP